MANERLAGGNSESEYSSIDGICATQQILYLLDDEILREGTHSDNHSAKTNEMAQSLLYTFLLSRWAGQNQAVIPKNQPRRSNHAGPSVYTLRHWVWTGTRHNSHEDRRPLKKDQRPFCGLCICEARKNSAKGPLLFNCERGWPFFCHRPTTLYICHLYECCPLVSPGSMGPRRMDQSDDH